MLVGLILGIPMIVLAGLVVRRLHAQDWRVPLDAQSGMQFVAAIAIAVAVATRLLRVLLGAALGGAAGGAIGIGGVWAVRWVASHSDRVRACSRPLRLTAGWVGVCVLAVASAAVGDVMLVGLRGPVSIVALLLIAQNAREEKSASTQPQGSNP